MRVVTVGNAMVDVVAAVPRLPSRGGDVLASGGRLEVGGGGYRAIAAARAAGADTVYLGRIGTGPLGDLVAGALSREGVPAPLPRVPGADTGFVLTAVEADGERTFITVPGAESADPGDGPPPVRAGDAVHVHGYGLVAPGRAERVAEIVAALPAHATVLLDPGPFGADAPPAALERLLDRVDWWSGNAAEARAATGEDVDDAARTLATRVRRGAVVRRGAEGCVVVVRGAAPVRLTAPEVRAVDTTGAGDAHVGTFLALLAAGGDPVAAAAAANAAAARLVSRLR